MDEEHVQTILIVEPDDSLREHLAGAASNYNVIVVRQVASGVRAARIHHPSVVLLSLSSLDAPGVAAIGAFRGLYPDASIIATTTDLGLIRGAIAAGADDCILVPIDPVELIQRIEVAMARGVRPYSSFDAVYDALRATLRERREHDSIILIRSSMAS